MGEDQSLVTTGVDAFIALLQNKKLVSLEEAARLLRVNQTVLQNWVDFLVEEGIVGIEYKFITPYLFLRTDEQQVTILLDAKDEFFKKAASRNIDAVKAKELWREYLENNITSVKHEFFKKMDQRNILESKRDALWVKYEQFLRGEVSR